MRRFINKWTILVVLLLIVGFWAINVQDWHQLWIISSAPDNMPIVAMLFLVPFFTWLGVRQALANDRLVKNSKQIPNWRRRIIVKLSRGGQVGHGSFTLALPGSN